MIQLKLTHAEFEDLRNCLSTAKRVYTEEFIECSAIVENNPDSELKSIARSWGERKNTAEGLLDKLRRY